MNDEKERKPHPDRATRVTEEDEPEQTRSAPEPSTGPKHGYPIRGKSGEATQKK